jgi:high affinity Mn2+ porin
METSEPSSAAKQADGPAQNWNLHAQNTDIVQGDPAFSARYSGPGSLNRKGEVQETVTADVFAGARL